jgi:hypothetical protein
MGDDVSSLARREFGRFKEFLEIESSVTRQSALAFSPSLMPRGSST